MRIGSVIFGERFKPESARLLRCSRCAWAAGEVQTLHEMLAETEQEAASLRAELRDRDHEAGGGVVTHADRNVCIRHLRPNCPECRPMIDYALQGRPVLVSGHAEAAKSYARERGLRQGELLMPRVLIILEEDSGSASAFVHDGAEVLELPLGDGVVRTALLGRAVIDEGGIVEPHRAGDPNFAASLGPCLTILEETLAYDRRET